ncbi:MAG: LEPR-XLL domain-containing protein [Phycisphaerales bacterium]
MTNPNVSNPNRPETNRTGRDPHTNTLGPRQVETLEPRLLLSASPVEPIENQDDFAEYLASAGLGGLDQMDISVTLDVPEGFASASGTEQVAAMTGAGMVAVGTQPVGALTGKIVYVHGGHGRYDNGDGWFWQRPLLLEQNEDMSNQDMMSFLVDFLWNAGATVVPLRPVGHQANEIILDNDDTEVTFVGSWSNSTSSIFYGSPGDTPYRFATTSATETAYARYRPNVTEAGFYPVYAWTRSGSDRVNQLYRVTHAGGTTEVSVNHRRVGNGLVYLGTYYFEAGTGGYVDISNRNNESGVVIADMIRFGNGVGDINLGHGTSGVLREDEPGVYWIINNLGQGISSSEYGGSSATVSAPPRFAEYMNREQDGSLSDRVFISYHSNAGSGSNRGTLGLVNGNNTPSSATPNQFLLANTVSGEINDDMVALNGTFEHDWFNRTTHTLDRSDIEFGEINNNYINNEFDATIIEWLFHDNALDTDLMRDPEVRKAVARATYQGLQKYFNSVDAGATGLTFLPDPVTDVMAKTNGDGTVTVSWTPPAVSAIGGGTPTGYMIYTSLNGYGFDGGKFVAGGATTSTVMSGLDSANGTHYFKVVAVNAGGQSLGSQVVAATPLAAPPVSKVLIVNGFDRNDKGTNERYTVPGGTIDRVRLRYQNTGDYAVQVAEAIEAFNPMLGIDTVQNESVINLSVSLSDYDTVIWILGEESSDDDTFSAAEQFLVSNYINAGGDLFVSGSEIGWDLDALNNGRTFYNNTLGADYVSDDSNSHTVTGVTGSIFQGLNFGFDNGTQFYDTEFPDVITPTAGAVNGTSYVGGTGGVAAIQKKGSTTGDIVMLAFPFETITTAANRAMVMGSGLRTSSARRPSEVPRRPAN